MADDFATTWLANRARKPWQGPLVPGATGELTAGAQPGWRDSLAHLMALGANAATGKDYSEAKRDSETLMGLAPGTGTAMAAQDAYKSFGEGDYLGAGLNALGAIPDVGPVGKAMFVGLASRMADKPAFRLAKDLAEEGVSREEILKRTGWFQQHGDWKSEISDKPATITANLHDAGPDYEEGVGLSSGNLASAMEHPELYKAHPRAAGIKTDLMMGPDAGLSGSYTPPTAAWELGPAKPAAIFATAPGEADLRSVLLHETQHGVQHLEGFPSGGNPRDPTLLREINAAKPKAQELHDRLDQERSAWVRNKIGLGHNDFVSPDLVVQFRRADAEWRALNPEKAALIDQSFEALYSGGGPGAAYRRLAGEVEARNVSTRRDMSPEELRATPPWQTQDVPDELQIVRRRGRLAETMAQGGRNAL